MVLELCNRTVVLKDGAVQYDGPTKEIMSSIKLLEECGLEQPISLQGCQVCGIK
jgi:cobalt/nickel transport system ATP-binding protein